MKKKFLNFSLGIISKSGNYSEEKLEEIAYGLETIYLTVTKLIIIFGLAYILNIVWEVFLLLICFNFIRSSAYGIHASKSIYCLISSTLMFIGGAYLSMFLSKINIYIKIILCIISIIFLILYAPADTIKRPLINAKKRKKLKIKSIVKGSIYLLLMIYLNNHYITGFLLCGILETIIVINPLTYKIFKLPYNNYKTYKDGV